MVPFAWLTSSLLLILFSDGHGFSGRGWTLIPASSHPNLDPAFSALRLEEEAEDFASTVNVEEGKKKFQKEIEGLTQQYLREGSCL